MKNFHVRALIRQPTFFMFEIHSCKYMKNCLPEKAALKSSHTTIPGNGITRRDGLDVD